MNKTINEPKKPLPKRAWWIYAVLAIFVSILSALELLACLFILGFMYLGIVDGSIERLKPQSSEPAPSFTEIHYNMFTRTDQQWKEYRKDEVIGKMANHWGGRVHKVYPPQLKFIQARVEVYMGSPPENLNSQGTFVIFALPQDQTLSLQEGQPIKFSGRIRGVMRVHNYCEIELVDVTLE
jgi:hypothetical protein